MTRDEVRAIWNYCQEHSLPRPAKITLVANHYWAVGWKRPFEFFTSNIKMAKHWVRIMELGNEQEIPGYWQKSDDEEPVFKKKYYEVG